MSKLGHASCESPLRIEACMSGNVRRAFQKATINLGKFSNLKGYIYYEVDMTIELAFWPISNSNGSLPFFSRFTRQF